MMRTIVVISVLIVLGLVSGALAFNEPEGFRGVPWGTLHGSVSAQIPEMNECDRGAWVDGDCHGTVRIGGVVTSVIMLFSPSSGFEAVWLSFDPREFVIMKQIFVERYGQPTEERNEEIQTSTGARYQNTVLKWSGNKVVIQLERYGSQITASFASLQTRARYERELERLRERVKEGKKDL